MLIHGIGFNTDELDDDLKSAGLLRLSPDQKLRPFLMNLLVNTFGG